MSKFGDLISGKTAEEPVVETPVVEEAPEAVDPKVLQNAKSCPLVACCCW